MIWKYTTNMQIANSNSSARVVIWDLPTRVFHWLLVAGFAIAFLTSEDSRYLYAHVFGGYLFFGLLLFRFVWGAIGSHYARFRAFAYDWPSVTVYLKGLLTGQAARHIGHNPAGSWAIFAMLGLGLAISVTGLITFGGEEGHGPLVDLVSYELGAATEEVHEWLAWTMLGLVALHLAGVIVESFIHKENLIWSMITGVKEVVVGTPGVYAYGLLGVAMVFFVATSALLYFRGYLIETADQPYLPYKGPDLPDNAMWRSECGDCHLAYHPTLLPARSWQRMMDEQADHFGEDLSLDEATLAQITQFLTANAAETKLTEAAHEIARTVPPDESPQRITETAYWKHEHEDIEEVYWKSSKVKNKINCDACHLDAKFGTFEDSDMRLPELKSADRAATQVETER